MARSSRNAFSSDWRRQYFAAMRSRAAVRGKISPWCVPRRQSVAIFSLHASPKGPRTGKAPLPGNISPPCIQNELGLARYARHVSEKPSNRLSGMHSAKILPGRGPFRRTDPSNHARRANPAIPPAPPNSASARNPCAMAPSGHSGHRQQHQRRHPRHHRFAGSPRCLRLIDSLLSLSAVPRSHPLQLRLPWRSAFPTRDASLRLYFVLSAVAIGI